MLHSDDEGEKGKKKYKKSFRTFFSESTRTQEALQASVSMHNGKTSTNDDDEIIDETDDATKRLIEEEKEKVCLER